MAPAAELRTFQLDDYDRVIALWRAAGLRLSRSDSRERLAQVVTKDPELFMVAVVGQDLVGTVLGRYDGRRGWVNHLAVAPSHQGRGLGEFLMRELESRLQARGCDKINLLITPTNGGVQGFYERLGYHRDELIFMEKWLG